MEDMEVQAPGKVEQQKKTRGVRVYLSNTNMASWKITISNKIRDTVDLQMVVFVHVFSLSWSHADL